MALQENCPGSSSPRAAAQMQADGVQGGGLTLEVTPCRKGACLLGFNRAHVPYPFHEIEGYGNQSKDRYKAHQDQIVRRGIETETKRCEHQGGECHLRRRVELRYHQRLHRDWFAEQP